MTSAMLGKAAVTGLLRTGSGALVPRRAWTQVGHVICIPPRVKVSFGEKILHGLFMYVVWFTPIAYFSSQIKVWRRKYIED